MVKNMVRLALACEYQRKPIRRAEISEKVLGTQGRQFKKVFEEAQEQLRHVFGMQMVELPSKEKVTIREKRGSFTCIVFFTGDELMIAQHKKHSSPSPRPRGSLSRTCQPHSTTPQYYPRPPHPPRPTKAPIPPSTQSSSLLSAFPVDLSLPLRSTATFDE